jgi:hypothetical protein
MIAFMIDNDNFPLGWIEQQNKESFSGLREQGNAPDYEIIEPIQLTPEQKEAQRIRLEEYRTAIDNIRAARRIAPPDDDIASEVYK